MDELAAGAYDAVARDLLARIEAIQKEQGNVSRELEAPLLELGKLYVSANQCRNAIPILRQAIQLTQRLDGVMNPRQLPMHEPLLECIVALDLQPDLVRAQEHMLRVNETQNGKDDSSMLQALAHAGEWYEKAGWYEFAREIYARAMRIARKEGGDHSVQLVKPLRATARTYRLELQHVTEPPRGVTPSTQGQRLLERAARIVRESEGVDADLKIETLLTLADWYQMSGSMRGAAKVYTEAWNAAEAAYGSGEDFLGWPEPIRYRAAKAMLLHEPPYERDNLKHYWVDFEFTVTRAGAVEQVIVKSSTAPKGVQSNVTETLKKTHYRPRFVDGAAVDTTGMRLRQSIWVEP